MSSNDNNNTDDVTILLPGRRHGLSARGLAASGRKARIVWSLDQKIAVMKLCAGHVALLKQRKCDAMTIAAKSRAWADITRTYNADRSANGDDDVRSAFEIKGVFERVTTSAKLKLRANDPNQRLDKAEAIIAEVLIASNDPCIISEIKQQKEQDISFDSSILSTSPDNNNNNNSNGSSPLLAGEVLDLSPAKSCDDLSKRRRIEDDQGGNNNNSSISSSSTNETIFGASSVSNNSSGISEEVINKSSPNTTDLVNSVISSDELRALLVEESRLRIKVMSELYDNLVRFRQVVEPRLLAVLDRQLSSTTPDVHTTNGQPNGDA